MENVLNGSDKGLYILLRENFVVYFEVEYFLFLTRTIHIFTIIFRRKKSNLNVAILFIAEYYRQHLTLVVRWQNKILILD
jgi:hypothetical protein